MIRVLQIHSNILSIKFFHVASLKGKELALEFKQVQLGAALFQKLFINTCYLIRCKC